MRTGSRWGREGPQPYRYFCYGASVPIDAGGIPAGSRWLSGATPPVTDSTESRIPAGMPAMPGRRRDPIAVPGRKLSRRRWHPSGVRGDLYEWVSGGVAVLNRRLHAEIPPGWRGKGVAKRLEWHPGPLRHSNRNAVAAWGVCMECTQWPRARVHPSGQPHDPCLDLSTGGIRLNHSVSEPRARAPTRTKAARCLGRGFVGCRHHRSAKAGNDGRAIFAARNRDRRKSQMPRCRRT